MFQEMLAKLAASKGAKSMPSPMMQGVKKPNMKSAFRSLAIKRKVKGRGYKPKTDAANTGSMVDNSDNSY